MLLGGIIFDRIVWLHHHLVEVEVTRSGIIRIVMTRHRLIVIKFIINTTALLISARTAEPQ